MRDASLSPLRLLFDCGHVRSYSIQNKDPAENTHKHFKRIWFSFYPTNRIVSFLVMHFNWSNCLYNLENTVQSSNFVTVVT